MRVILIELNAYKLLWKPLCLFAARTRASMYALADNA